MAPPRLATLPSANCIFVNRGEPLRIFEDAALAIPSDRSLVKVFFGVGGQGKTALCREIFRRLDASVEPTFEFLKRAQLDLHGRSKDDPDKLLVWIRNAFAEVGISFPCFDLAFALAWEMSRGEEAFPKFVKPWLGRSTAFAKAGVDEGVSMVKAAISAESVTEIAGEMISGIPGVGPILKRIGHWSIEKGKRSYLEFTKEALKKLYDGDEIRKPYELSELLPWMLAQDLNAHLSAYPRDRFVLLVDEYERVFDEGGAGTDWREYPFDKHIRTLIAEANGLLAVFFSRERLPWSGDPDWREELKNNEHRLGGLGDTYADDYLRAIPIDSAEVRRAIIASAKEEAQETAFVYPLLLSLQVEHWRALTASKRAISPVEFDVASETFEARQQEIVSRILRDYGAPLENTLRRLSVCRRFDRESFDFVVQKFGTALPLDQFDRIASLSFISQTNDGRLVIHNAIAETLRQSSSDYMRDTSTEALFDHFDARASVATPLDVTDEVIFALSEAAYLRCAKGADIVWLVQRTTPVREAGRHAVVLALWREAQVSIENRLGASSTASAVCLNNIATSLTELGNTVEARSLLERAIEIPGVDARNKLMAQGNLATLLHSQGDYSGAAKLNDHVLRTRILILGDIHEDVALSHANLGSDLNSLGDLKGAAYHVEKALLIRQKLLRSDDIRIARASRTLGGIMVDQDRFDEAKPLLEKSIQILEQKLGGDHSEIAGALDKLSKVLAAKNNAAGAQQLLERALQIREATLGPEHRAVAVSLNNLANCLQSQGNLERAHSLYQLALERREKYLAPNHPEMIASMSNLATAKMALGDLSSAGLLFEKAVALSSSVRWSQSEEPSLLNSYGAFLLACGRNSEARVQFERALAMSETILGEDHSTTATSLNNLAASQLALREFKAAASTMARCLTIHTKLYGIDDARTVVVREHFEKMSMIAGRLS